MAGYLILGAGKFGRLALKRLARLDRGAQFLVVDRDPQALTAIRAMAMESLQVVEADVITFLAANLRDPAPWDWLIPMVPVHVAYAWLRQGPPEGDTRQTLEVPEIPEIPGLMVQRGGQGELYLSCGHLCPDDCPEPDTVCPVSGESRRVALYDRLAALEIPGFQILVVPTRSLAPGVGGYPPESLRHLAEQLLAMEGKVLIATACRCHGVIHGLEIQGEPREL